MQPTLEYILEKYNITVGHQYFIDIPEMIGSTDLAKLFAELGFTAGVEIGTDEGIYAEFLCQTIPNLRLVCVDPWKAEAYKEGEQPESGEDQSFFDTRFGITQQRLKPYQQVAIIRETSMDALKLIGDGVLDFVYIDGNHDFLNVIQDMQGWLKKLKPGGILSGHDYVKYPFHKYNHVKNAVQAYAKSYNLLPVFAVMQDKKGLKRDRYRSWFLVNP